MQNRRLRPARVTPPGASLRSELEYRGISQAHLARVIGRPPQFVSELVNGKRELTVDTARRLEAALDIPADFWMRREAAYRLRVAEDTDDASTLTAIRERARLMIA